jgi:hypothetical protein
MKRQSACSESGETATADRTTNGDPMTLLEIKRALRSGPYAWPGGYPLFFITSDGAALSFKAVRKEWRNIVDAHLRKDTRCGWHIAAVDVNWEDSQLTCDHTNEHIESAYGDNAEHGENGENH